MLSFLVRARARGISRNFTAIHAAACACIVVLSAGCRRYDPIIIKTHTGQMLTAEQVGDPQLIADENLYTYSMEHPIDISTDKRSLAVDLLPNAGLSEITLKMVDDPVFSFSPEPVLESSSVRYFVPLEPGMRFDTVDLRYRQTVGRDKLVRALRIEEELAGIQYKDPIRIDSRLRLETKEGNPSSEYVFDAADIAFDHVSDGHTPYISITYSYVGEDVAEHSGPARISIEVYGDSDQVAYFLLRPRTGRTDLYFYEGSCGFPPQKLKVTSNDRRFSLESFFILGLDPFMGSDGIPMPMAMDLGSVIVYDKRKWRRTDYELFSWNLFPQMLIMDTASYQIQSSFFKRLAFYVEKKGTAGSLVPDEKLAGQRGWNAHDYRAEDLSRFYNRATIESFALSSAEEHLRDILVANGIISKKKDGTFLAGVGGVISVSQESSPRLRNLFLNHEGYHGLFFTREAYRDTVLTVWNALSNVEQTFWKAFLSFRNYNPNDEYLVANELQAYLMQVTPDQLDAYYWNYAVPELYRNIPSIRRTLDVLQNDYADTFHRTAAHIEAAAFEAAGIGPEDLFCLLLQ